MIGVFSIESSNKIFFNFYNFYRFYHFSIAIICQIHWYSNTSESSEYTEIVTDEKYKIHPNGSLSIFDVQTDNEGFYVVKLSNRDGTTSMKIDVNVIQQIG